PGIGLPGRAAKVAEAATAEVPTVAQLKAAARAGYESPELEQLTLTPEALPHLGTDIKADLIKAKLRPTMAPKTFDALEGMQTPPEGGVTTFPDVHATRQLLGGIAGSADPQERMAATMAIRKLDRWMENPPAADVISGNPSQAAET